MRCFFALFVRLRADSCRQERFRTVSGASIYKEKMKFMSEVKRQEKNYILATVVTVAVFCMGQIPGSIDAAISKISTAFNLSSTAGLYVTTVACLVSVAFSILLGFVAGKKIGFKPLLIFCAAIEFIAGVVPFFAENYVVLLILRGLFGIGYGGMQSMENTVAAKLVSPERRAKVLGLGMFFGFGMNCILQFIGGVLADFGWNYVFLNHLLLIIPLVIVIIGCTKLDFTVYDDVPAAEGAAKEESAAASSKLTAPVFMMWILMLFAGCMISPLLIGCSFLSEAINDSATVAGIVAVCFSVGCMIGGLAYPPIYKKLQRGALPLFLIIGAIGLIGSAAARNIVLLCIMIFIGGFGFAMIQSMAMMILTMSVSSSRVAFVSAIMMALFNFGVFLSSTYEELVGKITGDTLYAPIYVGAVIFVIFAVVYFIFTPLKKQEKKAE